MSAAPQQVGKNDEEADRRALLAALRVARAKARIVLNTIDEIGLDLKAGYITPREAMRQAMYWRIDGLFPRESDA